MARVRKGNLIMQVDEAHVSSYVSRGYDVISDGGAVLKRAVPTDLGTLQRAYTELATKDARLKSLEDENSTLKKRLEKLQEEMQGIQNRNAELQGELDALKAKKRSPKKDVSE